MNRVKSIVIAAAVCAMLAGFDASGQGGRGGGRGPGGGQGGFGDLMRLGDFEQPEFSTRDIPTMVNVLGLDEVQRDIITGFVEQYQADFNAENEKFRDDMARLREQLREEGGANIDWRDRIEPLRARMESTTTARRTMRDTLLNDVKAVLLAQQLEKWPAYERVLRRRYSLPRGLISGERVDLFAVVESAGLDESSRLAIAPVLADYELQLDDAIVRRDQDMQRAEEDIRDAFQSMDIDLARQAIERQRKLRVRLRDINDQFATQIESNLADPAPFRAAYRDAAFPQIYRETWGMLSFESALAIDGLDPATRSSIEALHDQFTQRIAQLNEQLERVYREEEPKRGERMLQMFTERLNAADNTPGGGFQRMEDPIRLAEQQRSEYERQMVEQMSAMLTPEQVALLPADPRRPGDRGEFRAIDGFDNRGRGGGQRGPRRDGSDDGGEGGF